MVRALNNKLELSTKTHILLLSFIITFIACTDVDHTSIVLKASKHAGRQTVWQKRSAAGKATWGIRGSGESESGKMWFNSFPGSSGEYSVKFGVVLEGDGRSEFKIFVDDNVLKSGKFPLACSQLECSIDKRRCPPKAVYLSLGHYNIPQGSKIVVWGKSVYPCGPKHGAYCRWFELRFEKMEQPGN
jgi:hypothetical protein